MKSRGPYRRYLTLFKLQLCQDIPSGVIGRRDAQRTYGVSANLIQLWLTQFDRGELAGISALDRFSESWRSLATCRLENNAIEDWSRRLVDHERPASHQSSGQDSHISEA